MSCFVKNYRISTYHGEDPPPPMENPLDEIIQDAQLDRLFDAYVNFDDGGNNDDCVGGIPW